MPDGLCDLCEFQEICEMTEELPEMCPYRECSPVSTATERIKDALEELIEVSEEDF